MAPTITLSCSTFDPTAAMEGGPRRSWRPALSPATKTHVQVITRCSEHDKRKKIKGDNQFYWPRMLACTQNLVLATGVTTRLTTGGEMCTRDCIFGFSTVVLPSCLTLFNAGDKSALRPSGLRFGSPALTSRGLVEEDFCKVAEFIHRSRLSFIRGGH